MDHRVGSKGSILLRGNPNQSSLQLQQNSHSQDRYGSPAQTLSPRSPFMQSPNELASLREKEDRSASPNYERNARGQKNAQFAPGEEGEQEALGMSKRQRQSQQQAMLPQKYLNKDESPEEDRANRKNLTNRIRRELEKEYADLRTSADNYRSFMAEEEAAAAVAAGGNGGARSNPFLSNRNRIDIDPYRAGSAEGGAGERAGTPVGRELVKKGSIEARREESGMRRL